MSDETIISRAGPAALARDLVLKRLGRDRVAKWCGVSQNAVSQWLTRATDAEPFPLAHVLPTVRGAWADDLRFDIAILWPPFRELSL